MKTRFLFFLSFCKIMLVNGQNTGIGTTTPSAQLHTTGTLRFQNYPSMVLSTDASGNVTAATVSTTPNIYTADGTLAGNRFVNIGSNTLNFSNGTSYARFNHSATQANLYLSASTRSIIQAEAGSGGTLSTMYLMQDAAGASRLQATNASTQLLIGTATGSTAPVYLATNGSTALTILNGGNVGIGTITPSAQLHTTGTVRFSNYPSMTLATDASGNLTAATYSNTPNIYTANGSLISNRTVTQGTYTLAFSNSLTNGFSVGGNTFSVDAANGRIGMGTTAPSGRVELVSDNVGGTSGNDFYFNGYGTSKSPGIFLGSSGGTASSPSNLANGDEVGGYYFSFRAGGAFSYNSAGIMSIYKGNGTTIASDLRFRTSTLDRMTVDENGNIGIGTIAPSAQLHTTGTVRLANYPSQILATDASGNITTASAATTPNIYTANGTLTGARTVTQGANTLAFTSTATNGFSVDGTTFSVDGANDRVGIGTASPTSFLSVKNVGTAGASSMADISNTIAGNTTDALTIGINNCGSWCGQSSARNIVLYNANPTNTSTFSTIDFVPTGASTGISGATITGMDRDATNNSAGMDFQTRDVPVGSGGTGTTNMLSRLTIRNTGKVGIGVSAPQSILHVKGTATTNTGGVLVTAGGASIASGTLWDGSANINGTEMSPEFFSSQRSSTNYHAAHPAGTGSGSQFVNFAYAGTSIGSITQNGTTGVVYNTTSDMRLKENIKATHFGLADIMKIDVKDYNYKSDKEKIEQTGFLAQQLYKIYPGAVTVGGEDASKNPWQVDYSKLTPLLVKAVQEQQAEIDTLKAENTNIKSELAELKNTVGKIQAEMRQAKMNEKPGKQ